MFIYLFIDFIRLSTIESDDYILLLMDFDRYNWWLWQSYFINENVYELGIYTFWVLQNLKNVYPTVLWKLKNNVLNFKLRF